MQFSLRYSLHSLDSLDYVSQVANIGTLHSPQIFCQTLLQALLNHFPLIGPHSRLPFIVRWKIRWITDGCAECFHLSYGPVEHWSNFGVSPIGVAVLTTIEYGYKTGCNFTRGKLGENTYPQMSASETPILGTPRRFPAKVAYGIFENLVYSGGV